MNVMLFLAFQRNSYHFHMLDVNAMKGTVTDKLRCVRGLYNYKNQNEYPKRIYFKCRGYSRSGKQTANEISIFKQPVTVSH